MCIKNEKVVLIAEYGVFVIKRYYQSCSIKEVKNDFTQEFLDAAVPTKKAILDLVWKFETEHTLDDLSRTRRPTVHTPAKKEAVKNDMMCCSLT